MLLLAVLATASLVQNTWGHGILIDPPGRSYIWRLYSHLNRNYQDNEISCGGAYVQWYLNDGNCGICGDDSSLPHPQPNENTGIYGQGFIGKRYSAGSVIDVEVYLVANHLGAFTFGLCELEDPSAPESGEECFKTLPLADGSQQYNVKDGEKNVTISIQLPQATCERCVLRWNYRSGNNWGDCGDGRWEQGCGVQETFRNCADIAIE